MRPAPLVALAAALTVTACSASGITAPRLQGSVAGAFSRLYVMQQRQQGQPTPEPADLQATAACQKGTPAMEQAGAGNDWLCQVTFLVAGPATPVKALYTLDVHPDGCWSADGDGPASVNGSPTILDPAGDAHPNPLYLIDGCFDAG